MDQDSTPTQKLESDGLEATTPQPAPEPGPQAKSATPRRGMLDEFTGSLGSFAREKRPAFVVLLVLAAVTVGLLIMAGMRAVGTPPTDVIEADVRERVAVPEYDPGDFGPEVTLVRREVNVVSATRTRSAIESSAAAFGASAYANVQVNVVFSGGPVTAQKSARLGYACVDDVWQGIGEEVEPSVVWSTSAGVDQTRVRQNISVLLSRAEETFVSDGTASAAALEHTLSEIYAEGTAVVTSEEFDADAQTDALKIRCRRTGSFETYECTIDVLFAFRPASGQWEIEEIGVSGDAKTRTFSPLLGTWAGQFASQETSGTKCLGARSGGITINITKTETTASGTKISGTLSGVAHYHAHPEEDVEASEGDLKLSGVPFTATYAGTGADEIVFVATLPEDVGGTSTLTLTFGPGTARAQLQSTSPQKGSFLFIPVEESVSYTDTFELTRG